MKSCANHLIFCANVPKDAEQRKPSVQRMHDFLPGSLGERRAQADFREEGQAEMAGNELDMQTFVKYAMVISEVILVSE